MSVNMAEELAALGRMTVKELQEKHIKVFGELDPSSRTHSADPVNANARPEDRSGVFVLAPPSGSRLRTWSRATYRHKTRVPGGGRDDRIRRRAGRRQHYDRPRHAQAVDGIIQPRAQPFRLR